MDWKDIGERAFSTFWMALLITFPATAIADKDWGTVFTVVCAALMTGLSVVKNSIKQYLDAKKAKNV